MRLFLGLFLLFFLNFAEVKAASLDILVKQQKIALPYLLFKGKKQRGGVVIVNGEQSSEGTKLVDNLSHALAQYGWSVAVLNTSLQINTAPWVEQLPEALSALRKKNNSRMIVIHYGSQLVGSVSYFSKLQAKQVNGMIFISAFDLPENKETPSLIEKIPFPLFDITAQFDYGPVLDQAAVRRIQIKSSRYLYRQLPGAYHDYSYNKKILVANIHGWMKKLRSVNPMKAPIQLNMQKMPLH
ncbi:alpha/beta hydrolase [Legionella cardiaca]|uniref:Alpha/beta hydrolase n=1 Tax=Legionella cardiaca TaxID=1071983 RepID=A0ABY8ASL0_9GAMM|nr:alpha/beta hydrolase [Legionella cardiaca]WED43655.1 alpha/beta hydrolase [Legionella cardiaca]